MRKREEYTSYITSSSFPFTKRRVSITHESTPYLTSVPEHVSTKCGILRVPRSISQNNCVMKKSDKKVRFRQDVLIRQKPASPYKKKALVDEIIQPSQNDVIFAGSKYYLSPLYDGNRFFLDLIHAYEDAFSSFSIDQKSAFRVAGYVLDTVLRNRGRFLERVELYEKIIFRNIGYEYALRVTVRLLTLASKTKKHVINERIRKADKVTSKRNDSNLMKLCQS